MLRKQGETWGDYFQRVRTNDAVRAVVTITALTAFIYILPHWSLFSPIFRITQLTNLAGLAIIAIGLNLLTGYNGQISLGHSGIALAGAYAMGIAITIGIAGVELHPILAVIFAGAVGAAIGVVIGIPALRAVDVLEANELPGFFHVAHTEDQNLLN